jgi:hypothetical protein
MPDFLHDGEYSFRVRLRRIIAAIFAAKNRVSKKTFSVLFELTFAVSVDKFTIYVRRISEILKFKREKWKAGKQLKIIKQGSRGN